MLKILLGVALATYCLMATTGPVLAQTLQSPRVSAFYSTWDDYYFYAGFQVSDKHVVALNDSPTSQPQQDDDIEVFLNTSSGRPSVRTGHTYQMAVSAANGAYFSVGNGTKIPVAKAVYTYKYAAKVDGSLNDNNDVDTGYTIELAIPWQELGLMGPPDAGTVWGLNVISRDRETTTRPSSKFYTLSPNVSSADDVQDPSKWVRILFAQSQQAAPDSETVVCPHVVLDRYPDINGSIVSGEWPSASRIAFGTIAIDAVSPTAEQEPNTSLSPFNAQEIPSLPPVTNVPTPPHGASHNPQPGAGVSLPPPNSGSVGSIDLPGGLGSIKVIPGGSSLPTPPVPAPGPTPSEIAEQQTGPAVNPLTPKYPRGYQPKIPSNVSLTGSLTLKPARPPQLVMAIYRTDYNGDGRKAHEQAVWGGDGQTLLSDQPINGAGPWFSALRPEWHREQLTDLRRSGIDIALIQCSKDDPLLTRELGALVTALDDLKAHHQDYPMIGFDVVGNEAYLQYFVSLIPAEFRATVLDQNGGTPGVIAYADNRQERSTLADGTCVNYIGGDAIVVSPGRLDLSGVIGRSGGMTYSNSWQHAIDKAPQFVIVNSWNDFTHGTEVCASREYGEKYADDTRLFVNAFNGNKEWHAKYLSVMVPTEIRPQTLYEIPIRLDNAGTLPWRAGEGYALTPRWYKDGRLFEDSAPRIPVGTDVFPGQAITLIAGLVARNSYGDDLEPGKYVLEFDMVQGDDRWFSYAGDTPVQVPVIVDGQGEPSSSLATFISANVPTSGETGTSYSGHIAVRNDGSALWKSAAISYKIQRSSGSGDVNTVAESKGVPLGSKPIAPGDVALVDVPVRLTGSSGTPLPVGDYRIHWYVQSAKEDDPISGSYDNSIMVTSADPGLSFVLSDIPRNADTGRTMDVRLAIQNNGSQTWKHGQNKIGYHWYYLDGQEEEWSGGILTNLTHDVMPGDIDGDITAKVKVPETAGRYSLVFDMLDGKDQWVSTEAASKGIDLLQALVTVSGRGQSDAIDIAKYFDTQEVYNDGDAWVATGRLALLPGEMLPPDGTAEVGTNPLLLGKPGPPLYPSGYYSEESSTGRHMVQFLYPYRKHGAENAVSCHGQTIPIPKDFAFVHLLAMAIDGHTEKAMFRLGNQEKLISIADLNGQLSAVGASAGLRGPSMISRTGPVLNPFCIGDYEIPNVDRADTITLPNNPSVKVLAISVSQN